MLVQLLLHFVRQTTDGAVIEFGRQCKVSLDLGPGNLGRLTIDVALVFHLNLDLLDDLGIRFCSAGRREIDEIGIADSRPSQEFLEGRIALEGLAQDCGNGVLIERPWSAGGRAKALPFALDSLPLFLESLPASVIDESEGPPQFGQSHVGVVFAEAQPMFRPAGEHSIGLGYPTRDQVIDEDAQVGFRS